MTLKFIELFAGIGGFSLGFERAGMECIGHCEINPYAQKVLTKHWPEVPLWDDVTKIKPEDLGTPDVICGGFPCQDLSVAGKKAGIDGSRSSLYGEILRLCRDVRPKYIVFENVRQLSSKQDWFATFLSRLCEIGYDAEWEVISASQFGAPHKRERIWVVAYPNSNLDSSTKPRIFRKEKGISREYREENSSTRMSSGASPVRITHNGHVSDSVSKFSWREQWLFEGFKDEKWREAKTWTPLLQSKNGEVCAGNSQSLCEAIFGPDSVGLQAEGSKLEATGPAGGHPQDVSDTERLEGGSWNVRRSRITRNDSGPYGPDRRGKTVNDFWEWWTTEPDVGRVAHGVPSRVDRLRCLGNALVPQIAEYIGDLIVHDYNS